MFTAYYCSLIYRNKKVKSFLEGFLEKRGSKIILLNEHKQVIDSVFNNSKIQEDEEYLMDQMFVLCAEEINPESNGGPIAPAPSVKPMKRKRLQVTMVKSKQQNTDDSPQNTAIAQSNSIQSASTNALVESSDQKHSFAKVSSNNASHPKKKFSYVQNPAKSEDDRSRFLPANSSTFQSNKNHNLSKPNKNRTIPKISPDYQNNIYGITFTQAKNQQFRTVTIPSDFKNLTKYQTCLSQSTTELINLELLKLSKQYFKLLNQSKGTKV
jgi:hypothetical protein